MPVQRSAESSILPDVSVDGLVTDREEVPEFEPPSDLLGAPLLLQACLYLLPVLIGEALVTPGPGASPAGEGVGHAGPVATVCP